MNYALILVAAASMGVDVGWQPTRDGGFEYIIQIEPELLESLLDGQEIISDIPAFLTGVRTYRIRVGKDTLPKEGAPPAIEPAPGPAANDEAPAAPARPSPAREEPTPAAASSSALPAPAAPAPAGEGSRPFNDSVAPESPADGGTPFNERVAPEEPPADDIPDARAALRDDGPGLLGNDDEKPKTPADRYADRLKRFAESNEQDEETTSEKLDSRPAIEPPKAAEKPPTLPDTFVADDATKPLVNHAGYRDDDGPTRLAASGSLFDAARSQQDRQSDQPGSTAAPSRTTATKTPPRPWMPFTLALLGLFASMGGNCFLGWISWGFRERYLRLLDERKYMLRGKRRGGPVTVERPTEYDDAGDEELE